MNALPRTRRRAGDVLTAVYSTIENFFGIGGGIGNMERGFSAVERIAKSIEASAVNAAGAYSVLASGAGVFSDIMRSAAAVNAVGMIGNAGAFIGNGAAGGGEIFSANRKGIDMDGSTKNFSFDIGIMGISGGIALALQYSAAMETARNSAFGALGMIESFGALGIAINEVRDNVGGAYEITLSFGGILGGTIAVALAALGNSVIWVQKLCEDSMAQIGNSAMILAAFFGGIWNQPLSAAAARFVWFGNSALAVIGAVTNAFGSLTGDMSFSKNGVFGGLSEVLFGGDTFAAPFVSVNKNPQNNFFGGLKSPGETLFRGNAPIFKSDLFYRNYPFSSSISGAFSGEYIRYDQAFAAGYLIGDILMRSAGIAGSKGGSGSEKIFSEVSKIAENTTKTASVSEISVEDLKFLRDIAARDVINRFTTAQISVSMGGVTNNLSGTADLDGIVDYLANGVKTAMESAAEGVHS